MQEIIFPSSTSPGKTPQELGGRLINCVAEPLAEGAVNKFSIRRDTGLRKLFSPGTAGVPRGTVYVNGTLYYICGTKGYSVTAAAGVYTVTTLTGTISGSGKATMAANMKSPTRDIMVNTDGADYTLTASAISAFSDGDLPAVNSVCFIGGYFIWSSAFGKSYASGLNATTVSGVDNTTAEASYDGLKRAVALGVDLLLMGDSTIEVWTNVGNETGFPFTRSTVIPIGVLGTFAIAGHEFGFPGGLAFITNDNSVHLLNGISPKKISPPELDALIKAVDDKTTLELSVCVAEGRPYLVVSSETWTWAYNFSTSKWHEKASYQNTRWQYSLGVEAFGEWLVFDKDTGDCFALDGTMQTENLDPLPVEIWSAPKHSFPWREVFPRADFYFRPGVGVSTGQDPIETDPSVRISWSNDCGVTFSNPVIRKLGEQGKYKDCISVSRTGRAGRQGRVWKLQISDPVSTVFLGGAYQDEVRK